MQVTFGKKHLLAILKDKGLPHTYKTILEYEKLGIIKRPKGSIEYSGDHNWRIYTQIEIDKIVSQVEKYKNHGL